MCRYEAAGAYLSDSDWCETGGGVHARPQGSLSTSRGVSCPSFGGPENTWCSMNEATTLTALDSLGRWMESVETANAVSYAACEEELLRMVSQADLDAAVAEATEGLHSQEYSDAAVADQDWHRSGTKNWGTCADDGKDAACAAIAICEGVGSVTRGWSFNGIATGIPNAARCGDPRTGRGALYQVFRQVGQRLGRKTEGLANTSDVPQVNVADVIQYCDHYFLE